MIRAHVQDDVLTVDVGGPATMLESPTVSELAGERVAHGGRAVRIDLRDCTMMDSTFSGTLLAIERQLERVGGSLTLVSPSPRVVELLTLMGVEDLYDIVVTDRVEGPWRIVSTARPRDDKLQRVVLDAHDELAALPGAPGRAFRAVVEELTRPAPAASSEKPSAASEGADGPESMRTAGPGQAGRVAHLH